AAPPPSALPSHPRHPQRIDTPARKREAHTLRRPGAAASPAACATADTPTAAAAACRTRCRGRASCRIASAPQPPSAALLRPTEFLHGTTARPAIPEIGFPGTSQLSCTEQALKHLAESGAVHRIGQRELHERLKVARKIPDIVALLVRRELHRHHTLA